MSAADWPRELKFTITEDHLKLLRHLNFRYEDHCEFGAPAVDPKRPYGNSGVYEDLREILGRPQPDEDSPEYYGEVGDEDELLTIHKEMNTVLQIIARTGEVRTGTYNARKYFEDWQPE